MPQQGLSARNLRPTRFDFFLISNVKLKGFFFQVNEKWEQSTWSKRMAVKAKRAGLTDLDRFKLRKAKSARNKILAKALNAKKKTLRKAGKL